MSHFSSSRWSRSLGVGETGGPEAGSSWVSPLHPSSSRGPFVFWLIGTRRYRAAITGVVVAAFSLLVPWALVGFDGLLAYPRLLNVASEVYGTHSLSVSTMLSALGLRAELATLGAPIVGLAFAAIAFLAGRRSADEVSISVAACCDLRFSHRLGSQLRVPIGTVRDRWPRFSVPWLLLPLLYLTYELPRPWLYTDEIKPGGTSCCPPPGVPSSFWALTHADPALWPALGYATLGAGLVGVAIWNLVGRKAE